MSTSSIQEEDVFNCPLCNIGNRAAAKFCRRCGISREVLRTYMPATDTASANASPSSSAASLAGDTVASPQAGGFSAPEPPAPSASSAPSAPSDFAEPSAIYSHEQGAQPSVPSHAHSSPSSDTALKRSVAATLQDVPEVSSEEEEPAWAKVSDYARSDDLTETRTVKVMANQIQPHTHTQNQTHTDTDTSTRSGDYATYYEQSSYRESIGNQQSSFDESAAHSAQLAYAQSNELAQSGEHAQSNLPPQTSPECPSCFTAVRTTDKFCCWCGETQPSRPQPLMKSCPDCAQTLPLRANYCFSCGRGVGENKRLKMRVPTELFKEENSEFFPTFDA